MKNISKIMIIAAVSILSSIAIESNAQDRQVLSGTSGRAVKFKKVSPYRVSDKGNVLQAWRDQVVYRAVNNTSVYKYRGEATTRHDETSSYGILFHTRRNQSVRGGHAYHNRGN